MKNKIFSLITVAFILFAIPSCKDSGSDTCGNGVQDGAETGVDCGGDCPACTNNNITVDGSSKQATIVATLRDGFYLSTSGHPAVNGLTMGITYTVGSSGVFTISYSNDDNTADCVHTGAYATDDDNAYALNPFGFGLALYVSFTGDDFDTDRHNTNQTITLTKCDPSSHKISGSFNLTTENDAGQTKTFAASFSDLTYIDAR